MEAPVKRQETREQKLSLSWALLTQAFINVSLLCHPSHSLASNNWSQDGAN